MMYLFVLLKVLQVFSLNEAFDFTCPSQAHWKLRSKSLCMAPRNYTCLYNVTFRVNIYRDKCNRPRILAPGYKYVFQPNLNRATCDFFRYQPFIFETDGSSDCTFLKSICNSQGQMTYENGNTTSDRTCICNTDKGYSFVMNPKNSCFCEPSTEDCSCYIGINQNNKTIGWKDLRCHDKRKISRSNSRGELLNTSQMETNNSFDNYKYNIDHLPKNAYRKHAALCVFIFLVAYLIVFITLQRIMRKWIRNPTDVCMTLQIILRHLIRLPIPKTFNIVESTDLSLTVAWCMNESHDDWDFELCYRREYSDDWLFLELPGNFIAKENGRCMYTLEDLSPETYYELKICSVYNHVKSQFTEYIKAQTLQLVLPEAIKRLQESDRNRFIELMKSSKTEKRYFVRIMIVGKGSVGKTCLMRRLLEENIENVTSTDGVDIVVRQCKINIKDGSWTIDKEISDDWTGRIQNAMYKNESIENEPLQTDVSTGQSNACDAIASNSRNVEVEKDIQSNVKNNDNVTVSDTRITLKEHDNKPFSQASESKHNTLTVDKRKTDEKSINRLDNTARKDPKIDIDKIQKNDQMQEDVENELLAPALDLMTNVFSTATLASNSSDNNYALCGLWDFAGQKEFYATHQAFLTRSAVYLVVADSTDDISKQEVHQVFSKFQNVGEYVDFWFDTIHCHRTDKLQGNEPTNDPIDPPIIMVFTGKDKYEKGRNFENREIELQTQLDSVFGKQSKYHHLRNVFYISNTDYENAEFNKLKKEISTTAMKMENWGQSMPLKWILLERLIEINKNKSKDFIQLSDMLTLAKHHDINILDQEGVLSFLRFQHEIGNLIFFDDIQDFIILNPKWLVDAFRCLVSDKINGKLQHTEDWTDFLRTGCITESLIKKLFEAKCKPEFFKQSENLIKVMEKFDILVKIDETPLYIMPSMMPSISFEEGCTRIGVGKPNCKRTSWLCLKFSFLPPAFFNHFCVWFIRKYKANNEKNELFRGICAFDFDMSGCEKLLVTMSSNTISLQILSFSTEDKDLGSICSNIREDLIRETKTIKKRYNLTLSYELHFKCSEGLYYKDTMSYQNLRLIREYLCKEHGGMHQSETIYMPWMMNADEGETKKKTEPDGMSAMEPDVTFINKLKDQKCFEGETVIFTCEVSQENVTGKWKKDGTDLESSKSIKITVNGRIHNLVMHSVTLNDKGYYSFKVTDKYSAAHLIIEDTKYIKLCRLLKTVAEPVIRKIFDREIHPDHLKQKLSKGKNKIDKLKKQRHINWREYDLLYPKVVEYSVKFKIKNHDYSQIQGNEEEDKRIRAEILHDVSALFNSVQGIHKVEILDLESGSLIAVIKLTASQVFEKTLKYTIESAVKEGKIGSFETDSDEFIFQKLGNLQVPITSQNFDIRLMMILMKNLIEAYDNIPDVLPFETDITEVADLSRVKHIRNKIVQNSDRSISDEDFEEDWSNLSQALERLGGKSVAEECKTLKEYQPTPQLCKDYLNPENLQCDLESTSTVSLNGEIFQETTMNILARDVVRRIFDKQFPPQCLEKEIEKLREHLTKMKEQRGITQSQWDDLFPPDKGSLSSTRFDIKVMIILLSNSPFKDKEMFKTIENLQNYISRPKDEKKAVMRALKELSEVE